MNSNFNKKLLQMDIKNISINYRQEKIAKFCSKSTYAIGKDLKDNSPMLSPQEIDRINSNIQELTIFHKKISYPTKKPKKPATNQAYAESLLAQSKMDTEFLLDQRLDSSVINYDILDINQQAVFKEFGLTFKFCPPGVLQRPYLPANPYIGTQFLEIQNGKIQYILASKNIDDLDYMIANIPIKQEKDSDAYRTSLYKVLKQEIQDQISKPFWILDSEITINLFEKVMGYHTNYFSDAQKEKRLRKQQNNELDIEAFTPACNIDWDVAILFCNRLSKMLGLKPCYLDYQGNPILSMREYWELSQVGKCPEFSTWGISTQDLNSISKDKRHFPKEIYELENVDPHQIQVNWDRSANGFRLPTTSEWIWALGTPPKIKQDETSISNKSLGKPQINDQFQMCSKTIGNSELCFDFSRECPMAQTRGWKKKTYRQERMPLDIINMDLPFDTIGKLKKDFYMGTPKQVSILEQPNIPKSQLGDLRFPLRMVKRWEFGSYSLAGKNDKSSYRGSNTNTGYSNTRYENNSINEVAGNNENTFRICKNID